MSTSFPEESEIDILHATKMTRWLTRDFESMTRELASPHDVDEIEKIASELNLETPVAISDVESVVRQFDSEFKFLDSYERAAPISRSSDGDSVPFSLTNFFRHGSELDKALRSMPESNKEIDLVADMVLRAYDEAVSEKKIETLSTEEARVSLVVRLRNFLSVRISGARRLESQGPELRGAVVKSAFRRGGKPVNSIGCNFSVSTVTPNLRVFWSGSFVTFANYFGAPTTPVIKTLQTGSYKFGVDGGQYGHNIQWDHAVVSLPGCSSAHLNY